MKPSELKTQTSLREVEVEAGATHLGEVGEVETQDSSMGKRPMYFTTRLATTMMKPILTIALVPTHLNHTLAGDLVTDLVADLSRQS